MAQHGALQSIDPLQQHLVFSEFEGLELEIRQLGLDPAKIRLLHSFNDSHTSLTFSLHAENSSVTRDFSYTISISPYDCMISPLLARLLKAPAWQETH